MAQSWMKDTMDDHRSQETKGWNGDRPVKKREVIRTFLRIPLLCPYLVLVAAVVPFSISLPGLNPLPFLENLVTSYLSPYFLTSSTFLRREEIRLGPSTLDLCNLLRQGSSQGSTVEALPASALPKQPCQKLI